MAQARKHLILEAFSTHAEPIAANALWKAHSKLRKQETSESTSVAMSDLWRRLKIGRLPAPPEMKLGNTKFLYCKLDHPGAELAPEGKGPLRVPSDSYDAVRKRTKRATQRAVWGTSTNPQSIARRAATAARKNGHAIVPHIPHLNGEQQSAIERLVHAAPPSAHDYMSAPIVLEIAAFRITIEGRDLKVKT